MKANIKIACFLFQFSILVWSDYALATMPSLTPAPNSPTADACSKWAAEQNEEAVAMWGILENGERSSAIGTGRLASWCLSGERPEIVGFGSSAGVDEAYCQKHSDHGICKRDSTSLTEQQESGTPVQWQSLGGKWALGGQCSDKTTWIISEESIRSSEVFCSADGRKPTMAGWNLFVQCKVGKKSVTLMGDLTVFSSNEIRLELAEYKGGAEYDQDVRMNRCSNISEPSLGTWFDSLNKRINTSDLHCDFTKTDGTKRTYDFKQMGMGVMSEQEISTDGARLIHRPDKRPVWKTSRYREGNDELFKLTFLSDTRFSIVLPNAFSKATADTEDSSWGNATLMSAARRAPIAIGACYLSE